MDDGELRNAVMAELARDANVNAMQIYASAHLGSVTLRGVAEDRAERRSAMAAAWRVPGVRKVDDRVAERRATPNESAPNESGPTAVAESAPRAAAGAGSLGELDALISTCRACPRLVAWREKCAIEKRASFRHEQYWGRPVPGFGPTDASILVVGLAPAAHGANRTGRMFTGDRSGDVLFAALHVVGLATQPHASHIGDGLELIGTRLTSPVRCAPPDNKPTPLERHTCAPFLARELELLGSTLRAMVVLGAFGWQALFTALSDAGWAVPRPRPRFAHGAVVELTHPDGRSLTVLGCFHVSQHNTFTGRLTPAMLEDVLRAAKRIAGSDDSTSGNGGNEAEHGADIHGAGAADLRSA